MNHRIGIGIIRIDAERARKSGPIVRLNRREAKALRRIARRDEPHPARAEDADAVEQDHVIVGPFWHQRLSNMRSATSINTIAGPVFTNAPSGSIQRSGVRIAAPNM